MTLIQQILALLEKKMQTGQKIIHAAPAAIKEQFPGSEKVGSTFDSVLGELGQQVQDLVGEVQAFIGEGKELFAKGKNVYQNVVTTIKNPPIDNESEEEPHA